MSPMLARTNSSARNPASTAVRTMARRAGPSWSNETCHREGDANLFRFRAQHASFTLRRAKNWKAKERPGNPLDMGDFCA